MIGATDSAVISRSLQYLEPSQSDRRFWLLLALQPQQQRAMFSLVTMEASLMICSQLAAVFLETFVDVNFEPQ
jgi:hypothetical protein